MSRLADATGRGSGIALPPPRYPWFTRVAIPLAIVAGATALLLASGWSWLVPARSVRGFPVLVEPIGVDAPAVSAPAVQAAGWVEPSPFPSLATALAGGTVREILVLEGERVARDQPIATLVEDEAKLAVEAARAELAGREATVALASARREAALAARDASDADVRVLEAEASGKRDQLNRTERAFASGGTSEAELVRLRLSVEAADAAIAGAAGKRREAEATVAASDAELAAARAGVSASQVALAAAELRLGRMTVRSPIDGTILERLVGPGRTLDPESPDGAAVASVYDPAHLRVRADVPNADIALVGAGMPAEITVEALPGKRVAGRVLRVLHRADIQKNTVPVQVLLDDPPGELRPGMLCRVTVNPGGPATAAGSRQRILSLRAPLPADGSFALVATGASGTTTVERRPIRLGAEAGDGWVEVLEGLRPGDVVLDAAEVREGDRIRVTGDARTEAADAR